MVTISSSVGWSVFETDARATRTTKVITSACMVMLQMLTIPPTKNCISMTIPCQIGRLRLRRPKPAIFGNVRSLLQPEMSELSQQRPSGGIRARSAHPRTTDMQRLLQHVGFVPTAVIHRFPKASCFLPAIPFLVGFLVLCLCVVSAANIG